MKTDLNDDESKRYPYWRRNRVAIPLANVLCGTGFNMVWPFLPLMARALGVRDNLEMWVGNLLLAFYLLGTAASPLWGSIADHYGRKPMVLRAMIGMGIALLLIWIAPTPPWFAAAWLVFAVFNGFTPAGISLLVANTPPARTGSAVALAQTGGQLGHALGPVVGAAIVGLLDRQHSLHWVGGGLMISGGLLVALYVRETKYLAEGPWRPRLIGSLRELLRVPRIAPLFLLAFLFSIMLHGSVANVSLFMLQLLEVAQPDADAATEASWVGAAASALAFSMMAGLPLWGRVIDRIGASRVLVYCTVATIVTHLPLLVLQTPAQLVVARVVFGLTAAGLQTAIFQLVRQVSPPGTDARALAYVTSVQFLAMGVAPFCAGLIGPTLGLRAYFAIATFSMGVGLWYWLRTARRNRNGARETSIVSR